MASPYAVAQCVMLLIFSVFFVHYIILLMKPTNRVDRGSSVGIGTRWTVQGSNPLRGGGGEILRAVQTVPEVNPTSSTMDKG